MFHAELESLLNQKINLSSSHITQASTSHNYVRDLLSNKSYENNSLPWITDGDFLSGSYARKTKIHPIDDIDIMIILDGNGLFVYKEGVKENVTVRGGGKSGSPVLNLTNEYNYISSIKVLNEFKRHLNKTYPDSKISKDGQAINVWLDSYGLGLDIVPAFHIIPNNSKQDYYFIPLGEGGDGWISTNPKIDQEIGDRLNNKFDKKLKPIIKLIKYWNRKFNNSRLRSYHLEVIVWKVFNGYDQQINSYHVALRYFFNNATKFILESCNDVTGLGDNIDKYLLRNDRLLSVRAIDDTLSIINDTSRSIFLGNKNLYISKWKKLFGDSFGQ